MFDTVTVWVGIVAGNFNCHTRGLCGARRTGVGQNNLARAEGVAALDGQLWDMESDRPT